VPDRVAHVADLPVAPLANRKLDHAARLAARPDHAQEPDARGQGPASLDLDTAAQAIEVVIVRHTGDLRFVRPLQLVPRMRHALGELAVVGEQNQALGIGIQPADGIEVPADAAARHQIDDGRALLRIRSRAHHAARLEHQQVPARRRLLEPAAIDLHFVVLEVRLGPELGDHAAVHLDSALTQQLVGRAS